MINTCPGRTGNLSAITYTARVSNNTAGCPRRVQKPHSAAGSRSATRRPAPPFVQILRDRVDRPSPRAVKGALAQVVALHHLLVRPPIHVRLVQDQRVQPAARPRL